MMLLSGSSKILYSTEICTRGKDNNTSGAPMAHPSHRHVIIALALAACVAATAVADDWPGFRGLQRQNVSASPDAPLHWSRTQNVRWRTPLPGEGHSSPIISGDAIYLSYAEERPQPARLLTAARLGLVVLAWAVLAMTLWAVVAGSHRGLGWRGLLRLVAMTGLCLAMAGVVLYGENVLTYDRALERGWMTAVLSLVLSLVLVISADAGSASEAPMPTRRSLWAAAGLVLMGGVAYLAVPDRAHAFDHGPLHPKTLFLLSVIVLPVFLGLMLGALGLRRARPRLALSLGLPGALLMLVGVTVLVMAIARAQRYTRGTVSVSTPYHPHLQWWLPVGLLAITVLWLGLRRVWPRAVVLSTLFVLSLTSLTLTALGFLLERLTAATPYLTYIIGQPYYHPIIAPWIALIFAGATILALVVAVVATRGQQAGFSRGGLPALLAVLLGAGCFAYILHVPRDRMFARGIICLDPDSGAVRWRTNGLQGPKGVMHNDNSAATPTPVANGEHIYAYFGTAGIMAVDRAGRLLWTYSQLPFVSTEGVASSPIVWGDEVIVLSESQAGQWLVALEGATGHLRWRTTRRHTMHMHSGNCRTPLIHTVQGRPTIIVWGLEDISGYDPKTGATLWSHEVTGFGSSTNPVACPVADNERIYLAGPTQTVAVSMDKLGRPGSPIAWLTYATDGAQCASPVLHRGLLFGVSDTGSAYCLEARTGKTVWEHSFPQQHYASPLAVGDRVYFTDTAGKTRVVACAPRYRLLAENDLKEPVSASVAAVDGRLYVRTTQALWCLRQGPGPGVPPRTGCARQERRNDQEEIRPGGRMGRYLKS